MSDIPSLQVEPGKVVLAGSWTLASMLPHLDVLQSRLASVQLSGVVWDLSALTRLDSAAAVLLWRTWGNAWPQQLSIGELQREVLSRAADLPREMPEPSCRSLLPFEWLGLLMIKAGNNLRGIVALFGQLLLDLGYLLRHPGDFPRKEFTANVYKAGAQALPVTALVGFLIGVTISYLSALQLKSFGADLFIVNILGISIIRELGPVLVAVLVAGRSGSAMTAQIGVMRVTEELDALATMGVSRSLRLVFPKVAALSLAMPLLVVWCAAAGIFGGMVSANVEMGLSYGFFLESLPKVVPVANVWIGMGKGFFFGLLIALVACHFGLKVRPNTESLSAKTTTAVVTAITVVIIVDAVFAVLTRHIGMPGGA